jgi:hypothetical protein
MIELQLRTVAKMDDDQRITAASFGSDFNPSEQQPVDQV